MGRKRADGAAGRPGHRGATDRPACSPTDEEVLLFFFTMRTSQRTTRRVCPGRLSHTHNSSVCSGEVTEQRADGGVWPPDYF